MANLLPRFTDFRNTRQKPSRPCKQQAWRSGCLLGTRWKLQNPPAMPPGSSRQTRNYWSWPQKPWETAKGKRIGYMSCCWSIIKSCCRIFPKIGETLKGEWEYVGSLCLDNLKCLKGREINNVASILQFHVSRQSALDFRGTACGGECPSTRITLRDWGLTAYKQFKYNRAVLVYALVFVLNPSRLSQLSSCARMHITPET